MAVGNVLQLVDRQFYGTSVGVINVYYYEVLEDAVDGNNSLQLADAFIEDVLPKIVAIQTSNMTHSTLEVRNLHNPNDFHSKVLISGNVGLDGGQALPPFVSWGFKFLRTTLSVRHGWKRICGVSEGAQVNGDNVPEYDQFLSDAANAMAANISVATELGIYAPRTVRLTYTAGELTLIQKFPIAGVVYNGIGTQNTRKFGRGS